MQPRVLCDIDHGAGQIARKRGHGDAAGVPAELDSLQAPWPPHRRLSR